MDSSQRTKKISMSNLLSGVVDKMLRLQPVVVDNRAIDLAQKQANIRAVSLREGFQSILARGDEMTKRIDFYRRKHAEMIAKRDGIDIGASDSQPSDEELTAETIVVSSS